MSGKGLKLFSSSRCATLTPNYPDGGWFSEGKLEGKTANARGQKRSVTMGTR